MQPSKVPFVHLIPAFHPPQPLCQESSSHAYGLSVCYYLVARYFAYLTPLNRQRQYGETTSSRIKCSPLIFIPACPGCCLLFVSRQHTFPLLPSQPSSDSGSFRRRYYPRWPYDARLPWRKSSQCVHQSTLVPSKTPTPNSRPGL